MLPGALLLIGIIFQNESPRWLVEKNRIEDARKALATVRALPFNSDLVERELEDIIDDFNGHEKMPLMTQIRVTCSDAKTFYVFAMVYTSSTIA